MYHVLIGPEWNMTSVIICVLKRVHVVACKQLTQIEEDVSRTKMHSQIALGPTIVLVQS